MYAFSLLLSLLMSFYFHILFDENSTVLSYIISMFLVFCTQTSYFNIRLLINYKHKSIFNKQITSVKFILEYWTLYFHQYCWNRDGSGTMVVLGFYFLFLWKVVHFVIQTRIKTLHLETLSAQWYIKFPLSKN